MHRFSSLALKSCIDARSSQSSARILSTHPQHIPQHAFKHASCLGCFAWGRAPQWFDSDSTVAAKAGADAPGGGISLCFCRRGCAAPAQKAATLNALPQRKEPSQRKNRRSEKDRRHEKPVPTLRSSSAAPGRAKISKGIGITLPEASYGFRQNCRNRESVWPLQRPSPW